MHMEDAAAQLDAFENGKRPEQLEGAIRSLEQVDLLETPTEERLASRRRLLGAWLQALQAIETATDASFNPEDRPHRMRSTVRVAGSEAYQEAVQENRDKAERYHLQSRLRFIEGRARESLERFIRRFYTTAQADRDDLADVLEKCRIGDARKEKLLAIKPG